MIDADFLIIQPDHGIRPVVVLLEGATKSITIKMFTFDHPALLEVLLKQAERGVHIRVLLNGAKATGERINDKTFTALEQAGIPVRWTSSRFLVTHEKSVVIDGARAMVSSFNFMEKYFSKTRDYGVVFAAPTQVKEVQACFEADWSDVPFKPETGTKLAWSPGHARSVLCEVIDSAVESIDVQHPKFAEPVILERLHAATQRGVRVRVLCGGKHGIHQPDLMYSFALWRLLRTLGAKVHKQRGLRGHAKLIVVDGKRAVLGTQNLDQPAFDLRRELSIVVEDKNVVAALLRTFQTDWDGSRRYEPPYPIQSPDPQEDAEFPHDPDLQHE